VKSVSFYPERLHRYGKLVQLFWATMHMGAYWSVRRPRDGLTCGRQKHGLKIIPRGTTSFTPVWGRDGKTGPSSLTLGGDCTDNARQIAQFSHKDARVKAKFHYTDTDTDTDFFAAKRTRTDPTEFRHKKVRVRVRVRVVEFSSYQTTCADFVRVGPVSVSV